MIGWLHLAWQPSPGMGGEGGLALTFNLSLDLSEVSV